MSDTPRTDKAAVYAGDITVCDTDVVPADFARLLERELQAWKGFVADMAGLRERDLCGPEGRCFL